MNINEKLEYSSLFGIKDYNIDKISSPSDLIGLELLPEYTSKSEYGVLKFNPIVIPDFSNIWKLIIESSHLEIDQRFNQHYLFFSF